MGASDTYAGNPAQEGDVLLYQSDNDGDINIVGGITEMTAGFDTMIYLTLYGGNVEDPGRDDKSKQWWGNWTEPDPARHYRGEYQNLIQGLPASSANLVLVEGAAKRDIERAFVDTKIADKVTVAATIPARNQIKITIGIEADGKRSDYEFTENWESTI
jgi:hypothetical protein